MTDPVVSIIIPVLDDTDELSRLLDTLPRSPRVEVIVGQGGRPDAAMRRLQGQTPDVTWVESGPGRAVQMNAGARRAGGRWLLFLHADARLDAGWLEELERVDAEPRWVGGSFRFTLDSTSPPARLIERGVAWRVRILNLPYGDQAIFVRRTLFERLGGYRELPLMEDVDLVRRLRHVGRLYHSARPIRVSARRWVRDGWWKRSVENIVLATLFHLGVSPARLARVYYRRSAGQRAVSPAARDAGEPATVGASDPVARPAAAGRDLRIAVIIPALNEAESIGLVLAQLPACVSSVTVADNGSTDATAARARAAGAQVVCQPRRGYGRACQAGLRAAPESDVIVFLDADLSDYPAELVRLVEPIRRDEADLVMGARAGQGRSRHARWGTTLCVGLVNRIWRTDYRDLGPFRAIASGALAGLDMQDQTWGWTIEMQVKAAECGLRVREVPIAQRARIGRSKISGTVRGTVRAAARMLATIASLWWTRRRRQRACGVARA